MPVNGFRRQSSRHESHGPAAVRPPGVIGYKKMEAGEAGIL